jgi:hypothetical protein
MKTRYWGFLFVAFLLFGSCSTTRGITSKNKIKVVGLRSFLDDFEDAAAANDRQELMKLMFPAYREAYGDSDEMMGDFFNVIDNDAHIDLLDYQEIDHLEFISLSEYAGGYGSKYAPIYKIHMKNGAIYRKDTWRIHLEDGVFYLSSAMG